MIFGLVCLILYGGAMATAGWAYLSLGGRLLPAAVDRALLALPAGAVLLSVVTFVLNWVFAVRFDRLSTLVAAVGLAALALAVLRSRSRLPGGHHRHRWPDRPALQVLSLGALSLLAFVGWMSALHLRRAIDPTRAWDFYMYHWRFTRILVESGSLPVAQVSPSIQQYQYAFPPLVFLLYEQVSHMLGGLSQLAPRLLPVLCAAGLVLVAGRAARVSLHLSLPASLCAASFALWSGFYGHYVLEENTDMPNAFFILAAAYWVLRRDLTPGSRILGGGLFLAGAYWTRPNGLAAFATLGVVLLLGALADRLAGGKARRELAVTAGALAVACVLIAPHLLRNLALWGNPLYPFFAPVLGGNLIDPWVLRETLFLVSPDALHGFQGDWFTRPVKYFPDTAPMLAILLAAVPPALRRFRRGEVAAVQWLLAAALYAVLYLLFMRVPNDGDSERHLLPMVALAAPLAGLVIEELRGRSWRALWTAVPLLALLVGYASVDHPWTLRWENLALALLLLTLLFAHRLPRQSPLSVAQRFAWVPIFALPFFMISISTWHALPMPTYVVRNGLMELPEADFIRTVVQHDRYLTFERRVEMLGGEPLPGDHPSLERFYREQLEGEAAVRELQSLGVRYIHWSNVSHLHPTTHPLQKKSPLFLELGDPAVFRRVYYFNDGLSTVGIYELQPRRSAETAR